jgi:diguanylate cyclase (GGDEF)-like protein
MTLPNTLSKLKNIIDLLPQAILWKNDLDFTCFNDILYSWSNRDDYQKNENLTPENLVDLFILDKNTKNNLIRFLENTTAFDHNTALITPLNNGPALRWKWLSHGICLMVENVTDWHLQLVELQTLSDTDPLTNLANRRRFQRDFTRLIAQGARNHQIGALILFDIDNLKMINDRWGHAVGDKILSDFGGFAKTCIRPYESLSRIGGDEFAIVTQHAGLQGAERLIESMEFIFNKIKTPDGQSISASFGVSLFNQTDQNIARHLISSQIHQDQIYAMADAELYKEKMLKKKCL